MNNGLVVWYVSFIFLLPVGVGLANLEASLVLLFRHHFLFCFAEPINEHCEQLARLCVRIYMCLF